LPHNAGCECCTNPRLFAGIRRQFEGHTPPRARLRSGRVCRTSGRFVVARAWATFSSPARRAVSAGLVGSRCCRSDAGQPSPEWGLRRGDCSDRCGGRRYDFGGRGPLDLRGAAVRRRRLGWRSAHGQHGGSCVTGSPQVVSLHGASGDASDVGARRRTRSGTARTAPWTTAEMSENCDGNAVLMIPLRPPLG
jgi:hypothetical protein